MGKAAVMGCEESEVIGMLVVMNVISVYTHRMHYCETDAISLSHVELFLKIMQLHSSRIIFDNINNVGKGLAN